MLVGLAVVAGRGPLQLSLEGVGSGGCNLILWSNSSFNLRSIINIVLQGPKRLQPQWRHNKPTLFFPLFFKFYNVIQKIILTMLKRKNTLSSLSLEALDIFQNCASLTWPALES